MENRRQQAQQRKADEEKARAQEAERKTKEEAERRKREKEEHTDKRPLKPTKKVNLNRNNSHASAYEKLSRPMMILLSVSSTLRLRRSQRLSNRRRRMDNLLAQSSLLP